MALLTLDRWMRMTPAEQEVAARQVERSTEGRFTWLDIVRFELGGLAFDIARFAHKNTSFMLVPGGEFTLGFNPYEQLAVTEEQLADWQEMAESYEIEQSIEEYLAELLTPVRTVVVPTLLVEMAATEIGLLPIGIDDPEVQKVLKEVGTPGTAYSYEVNQRLRVAWDAAGNIEAFRIGPVTHSAPSF